MEKTAKNGTTYRIENGKRIIWPAEVDLEAGEEPFDVSIPLRMKMKVLRPLVGRESDDVGAMFEMLEGIIPDQAALLDEMDLNDFMAMFSTWQAEYELVNGATLGEASGSSS